MSSDETQNKKSLRLTLCRRISRLSYNAYRVLCGKVKEVTISDYKKEDPNIAYDHSYYKDIELIPESDFVAIEEYGENYDGKFSLIHIFANGKWYMSVNCCDDEEDDEE